MRPLCPRCALPLLACLCRWVTPTTNRLPLLVLQHPDEARHAKGSVRLLQHSLARCHREVGAQMDDATLATLLHPPPAAGAPAAALRLTAFDSWVASLDARQAQRV